MHHLRSTTRVRWALLLALLVGRTATASGAEPLEVTLDNGLRVRFVPIAGWKEVVVLLGVRAGMVDEPAGLPHLAHLAEHLVFHSAPGGSAEAIAVDRWSQARHANGETVAGWMYFDLLVAPSEVPLALRVQAARLVRPEFAAATLRREVPETLAEIDFVERSKVVSPSKFALSVFVQAALHGQAEVPIRAKTRSLTLDDVRRFHAENFRPDRAVLLIVGGFDPDATRQAVNEAFGAIPRAAKPAMVAPEPPPPGTKVAHWDVATRHLLIAWPTPPSTTPDHAAMTLGAAALGPRLANGPAIHPLARLPDVSTEVPGFFLINATLRPGADPAALQARLLDQVRDLTTAEGFGDPAILRERGRVVGWLEPSRFWLAASSLGSFSLTRTNLELRRMGRELVWGDLPAYARRVEGLDGPPTQATLARLLAPDRAIVVRVEPVERH